MSELDLEEGWVKKNVGGTPLFGWFSTLWWPYVGLSLLFGYNKAKPCKTMQNLWLSISIFWRWKECSKEPILLMMIRISQDSPGVHKNRMLQIPAALLQWNWCSLRPASLWCHLHPCDCARTCPDSLGLMSVGMKSIEQLDLAKKKMPPMELWSQLGVGGWKSDCEWETGRDKCKHHRCTMVP